MTDLLNRTHLGDCRELMQSFRGDGLRVQCIVTSPPYWGLRDYGTPGQLGLRRIAQLMGYERFVSYNLPSESGASLRAAGFRLVGRTRGGSWDREKRPRTDKHPTQAKLRWEVP